MVFWIRTPASISYKVLQQLLNSSKALELHRLLLLINSKLINTCLIFFFADFSDIATLIVIIIINISIMYSFQSLLVFLCLGLVYFSFLFLFFLFLNKNTIADFFIFLFLPFWLWFCHEALVDYAGEGERDAGQTADVIKTISCLIVSSMATEKQ